MRRMRLVPLWQCSRSVLRVAASCAGVLTHRTCCFRCGRAAVPGVPGASRPYLWHYGCKDRARFRARPLRGTACVPALRSRVADTQPRTSDTCPSAVQDPRRVFIYILRRGSRYWTRRSCTTCQATSWTPFPSFLAADTLGETFTSTQGIIDRSGCAQGACT